MPDHSARIPTTPIVIAGVCLWVAGLTGRVSPAAWESGIGGRASFHSDEAIVGLMARHFNQTGSISTFFYGQEYMGSLDPALVSIAFRLFGENVDGIRFVQTVLYLISICLIVWLAWRLAPGDRSYRASAAVVSGLLYAVPTPLVATYTTVSLGGYGEMLVFGLALLLLIPRHNERIVRRALLSGLIAGLGWWTNSLIVMFILPAAIAWLITLSRRPPRLITTAIGLALFGFTIGAFPWIAENLRTGGASLSFLSGGFGSVSFVDKVIGYLALGLPAVIGVRYPWSTRTPGLFGFEIFTILIVMLVVGGYITMIAHRVRNGKVDPPTLAVIIMPIIFTVVFLLSGFGIDSTGRYLLPLSPLFVLLVGQFSGRIGYVGIPITLVPCVLPVGWLMLITVVGNPLTPQFDPHTDIPNRGDDQLIAFLDEIDATRGFSTYWVTYRFAFLTGERIQLAPLLPYKADLSDYGPDRYPLYTQNALNAAAQGEKVVYITYRLSHDDPRLLDKALETAFAKEGIRYITKKIGDVSNSGWGVEWTVYYNLSRSVTPNMLGFTKSN